MTKEQLKQLKPRETMVYANRDNVGYTYMGKDDNDNYLLCGMPYSYEESLILNSFHIMDSGTYGFNSERESVF